MAAQIRIRPNWPGETFQVRIKVDSEETVRRLRGLYRKLDFSRGEVIHLIQPVDRDGKLQNELLLAEKQMEATLELLEANYVDEREYLAEGVLMVESGFSKLRTFLGQLNKCAELRIPIPPGYYLRACTLAQEFSAKRTTLRKLRRVFEQELQGPKSGRQQLCVLEWLAKSILAAVDCCHAAETSNTTVPHREMEHIYSSGRCECKKYI